MTEALRAPFPWFGGKRRVADVVWRAFGPQVNNYVEPFAGSLAVLLARPGGAGKIETVNDVSRYVSNFWRAVAADPDAVAAQCDWPVNEADLHARHRWLVDQLPRLREQMHADPDFYDAKIAGWWVWGICQWIGGGWCAEPNNRKHPKLDGIGKGVHADQGHPKGRNADAHQRPVMKGDSVGMGVHSDQPARLTPTEDPWRKRPKMSHAGTGVHSDTAHRSGSTTRGKPRPNLNGGQGVHAQQLPKLSVFDGAEAIDGVQAPRLASGWNTRADVGRRPDMTNAHGIHLPGLGNDRGLNGVSASPASEWFRQLQHRLRRVRVACGDWKRVLGPSVLGKGKNVGGRRPCAVFLDPPYDVDERDPGLYPDDMPGLSRAVREWALEHGDDPDLRIALCGYAGEHEMPASWTEYSWKAARGYAGAGNTNRERERIWFSPHCLPIELQTSLFGRVG